MAELSGNEIPDPLTAYSGSMFLTFSSNPTVTGSGWTAYYETDAVGLDEIVSKSMIEVFPNPTNDILTIRHHNPGQEALIEVLSLDGRLMISDIFPAQSFEKKLWI